MKRMLDLFSGLKGASQAFTEHEDWEVVTIDINPEFNPTICCDLEQWDFIEEFKKFKPQDFDLIWASPPCVEFFKVLAPFFPEDYGREPSMKLVEAAKDIIDWLEPKWWVIENTHSGNIFIKKKLGPYRQKMGPFYLWGNFPLFSTGVEKNHKYLNDTWSDDPLRSSKRAKIPYNVSLGLLDTITNQKTLDIF